MHCGSASINITFFPVLAIYALKLQVNVIKPVNQGIGYVKNVEVYNLEKFGFDFLAGDPKLALFEDTLASDWSAALSGGEQIIRKTINKRI